MAEFGIGAFNHRSGAFLDPFVTYLEQFVCDFTFSLGEIFYWVAIVYGFSPHRIECDRDFWQKLIDDLGARVSPYPLDSRVGSFKSHTTQSWRCRNLLVDQLHTVIHKSFSVVFIQENITKSHFYFP